MKFIEDDKAVSGERITSRQIEAARVAMMRHVRRGAKVWIRIFPDRPVTKKPAETRQGKGKGSVEYYVAQIQPGRMIYEMEGVTEAQAREASQREQALKSERDAFANKYRASVRDSAISAAVLAADSGVNPQALADVIVRRSTRIREHAGDFIGESVARVP